MPEHSGGMAPGTGGAVEQLAVAVATAGYLGCIKPAPGTWGSLGAAVVALPWLLWADPSWLVWGFAIAAAVATVAGMWSCAPASRRFGCHDPGQVVIDEVAAVWLALALMPSDVTSTRPVLACLLVFGMFRVLDITKPGPVRWFERLPGAWGVMCDDLVAGVATAIIVTPLLA